MPAPLMFAADGRPIAPDGTPMVHYDELSEAAKFALHLYILAAERASIRPQGTYRRVDAPPEAVTTGSGLTRVADARAFIEPYLDEPIDRRHRLRMEGHNELVKHGIVVMGGGRDKRDLFRPNLIWYADAVISRVSGPGGSA
jgi:hypothetical protein